MAVNKAFVAMQIGEKDTPERRRADEIYNYIIAPALRQFDVEPYRADLDPSPGGITSKMLSELLECRVVIADLTGRNPNVFYELGIVHSFTKPLISIVDVVASLPFDAKDERVIEMGAYAENGLTYTQGEEAKKALHESLKVVLADGYSPPSPIRDVAANRSLDELAPDNPVAAELAQMRETLDDIRRRVTPRSVIPSSVREDIRVLQEALERNIGYLQLWELDLMKTETTSGAQDAWVDELRARKGDGGTSSPDPWAVDTEPTVSGRNQYSDEPPF